MMKNLSVKLRDVFGAAILTVSQQGRGMFLLALSYYLPVLIIDMTFFNDNPLTRWIILGWGLVPFEVIGTFWTAVLIALYMLFQIATLQYIHSVGQGRKRTLKECYQFALNKWGGYLTVVCLYLIRVLLWSLLLFIPGILAALRYGFSGMAYLFEEKESFQAMRRSRELVKPCFFKFIDQEIFVGLVLAGMALPYIFLGNSVIDLLSEDQFPLAYAIDCIKYFILILTGIFSSAIHYHFYSQLVKKASEGK